MFLYSREIDVKLGVKVEKDIFGIFLRGDRRVKTRKEADFLRRYRADTCETGVDRLCQRNRLFCQKRGELFQGNVQGICLVHGVRNEIFPAPAGLP